MGQIEDLRMFVTVVDEGSIARAGESLGIAKSAVSRRLAQLEDRYETRLIDRQPRTWEITKAGQELYQRAVTMVADADDLDADFIQSSRGLSGPLRVSLPQEFGMSFLKPTLFSFGETHPEIDLTVDFEDRTVDLERENYDLAVRITADDLTGLGSIRLGTTSHGLYASSAYLERHGPISQPSDLKNHKLLHYGADRRAIWHFSFEGKKSRIDFQPVLNSNYGAFLVDAAARSRGIIRLPDFIVAKALKRKTIVPILPEAVFPDYGVFLIHSTNRRINKRMRALISVFENACATLGAD